jgi:hypothetical protein
MTDLRKNNLSLGGNNPITYPNFLHQKEVLDKQLSVLKTDVEQVIAKYFVSKIEDDFVYFNAGRTVKVCYDFWGGETSISTTINDKTYYTDCCIMDALFEIFKFITSPIEELGEGYDIED